MCAVSAISDWGSQLQYSQWTNSTWNDYTEILRRLTELDKKLGLANCEDPQKAAWMKEVNDRLSKLENGTGAV